MIEDFFYEPNLRTTIKHPLRRTLVRSVSLFSNFKSKSFFTFYFLIFTFYFSSAQSFLPQNLQQARYEIDAKRIGVSPVDKDALPRSREFIRLDSTYYVGWMYEGMYKYNRSADYLGYKNAIPSLEKAFQLFDKDYSINMRNLLSSPENIQQNIRRLDDLYMIFSALDECYENIEMPDAAMDLMDRIDSYHFQRDFFHLYYHRSWICHRARFFTSAKYSFLQNTVADNEKLAFQWCYKGFACIIQNKTANDALFGNMQSEQDEIPLYHDLALLHCYNKNYDSSEYYYDKLKEDGGISWNNYGGMQGEIGNFANAQKYYNMDRDRNDEHMLQEPYYYLPELKTFAGKTKDAINMAQQIIAESGSTPGFGWYNIALARAYLYDGQLDSCAFSLDKASNFKELHIGTTLTQQQYDFTINLLKVELYDKKTEQIKFQNKGWWYSPTALYNIACYKMQKILAEYVVVNEMVFNPERDRLVYDLFCSESTTTFDEAWYLLEDFSPSFFEKKYEQYQKTDKRENIQRYFKLFAAKFKWENGEKNDAKKDLEDIERTTFLDTANEKLFLGRLYEAMSKAYDASDDKYNYNIHSTLLLEEYSQLVPFSGIEIKMKLATSGIEDATTKDVVDDLKDCDIQFVKDDESAATASINFEKKDTKYEATINVTSANGKQVVNNEKMIFSSSDDVGAELALRMFGKGGAMVFDPPQPQNK